MAETTADVRRDIELTRERMSSTLTELEQKLNLTRVVKDHPWPALALAVPSGLTFGWNGTKLLVMPKREQPAALVPMFMTRLCVG